MVVPSTLTPITTLDGAPASVCAASDNEASATNEHLSAEAQRVVNVGTKCRATGLALVTLGRLKFPHAASSVEFAV